MKRSENENLIGRRVGGGPLTVVEEHADGFFCLCDCGGGRMLKKHQILRNRKLVCSVDCPHHRNNRSMMTPEEIAARAAEVKLESLRRMREPDAALSF